MFDPLQNILPSAANKYGFNRQMKAIQICQEYRILAPTILPKEVLEQTFPKSYDQQILTVGVLNSAWAQQIMMHRHTLQKAINKKFGANTVKNIKIEISENLPRTF